MAEYVTKIRTENGDLQIDYNALANLPASDKTLSKSGGFADAKATRDAIDEATIIVDATLSNKGQAADAKETGLKFVDIENDIKQTNAAVQIAQETANNALPKAGGDISGPVNMNNNIISGIQHPSNGTDATNKDYVDSKHFFVEIELLASEWVEGVDQYEQTINVESILDSDRPHYGVIYGSSKEAREAQTEAFSLVNDLITSNGTVMFVCFEDKPEVDLNVQLEVNR